MSQVTRHAIAFLLHCRHNTTLTICAAAAATAGITRSCCAEGNPRAGLCNSILFILHSG